MDLLSRVWRRITDPDGRRFSGAEWTAAQYDRLYSQPGTSYTRHYTESIDYFLWTVIADRIPADSSILEIGCGSGQFAHLLAEHGVTRYTGFDMSSQAVSLARQRLPHFAFHVADALTTALLSDADYDTVVSTEVLEHIDHDLEVVGRVRPGVRCLMSVPNFPYPSHVRYFKDEQAVRDRYGSLFERLHVATIRKNLAGDCFFLMDGLRGG